MGLFDLFGGPKKSVAPPAPAIPPLLKERGVHVFANTHGRFGWDPTNPIPCGSSFSEVGAEKYLTWLKWKGAEVVAQRLGSVGVDGMPGMVDRYSLSVDEKNIGTIFLCAYSKNNSFRLPKGFSPSKAY